MKNLSFVVPVRNEEGYIRPCLQSLLEQDYPAENIEIIVADGRSSDRTGDIVHEFACQYPRIRLLNNPAGIVPTAMNIGIRAARGEVIIRADGHNVYPRDYAANCVKYLQQTGADNVGGPCITVAADKSFNARLVAAILSSPFGVGNSKFRTSREEGFVDTVPFGAFRRELFDRVGLYNEKLVRNQDVELNGRIRKAGGKIFLTPALTTRYHPVKTFPALLQHAFNTSKWNVFTLIENGAALHFRHLAPAVFLLFLVFLIIISSFSPLGPVPLLLLMSVYFLTGFFLSIRSRTENKLDVVAVHPFASFCFHVVYGAGILYGLIYLFREPSAVPIRPGLRVQEKAK